MLPARSRRTAAYVGVTARRALGGASRLQRGRHLLGSDVTTPFRRRAQSAARSASSSSGQVFDLNLTAEENIRLHAFLYGLYPFRPSFSWMPRPYRDQVRELASLLDIEKDLFRPIKTLSGGMRRKLEIIRSLMHSPRILFLDEPTLGLDPISRRNLWEYLVDVRVRGGTTVFLTTHYLEEAEHADRICVLDHGHIVAYGTPALLKGQLVEDYVLIDAVDRVMLENELTRLGIAHRQDRRLVRIDVQSSEVHALLKQIQTPLTVVQTHTPTLEDAYLGIIRAGEVEA